MNARRTTVGLSLLCALVSCAFAAQSASAQVGTPATNTTAFTCRESFSKEGDFLDEHCDKEGSPGKSDFAHVEIEDDETTLIEATNEKTANETKAGASITIKYVSIGVAVEITCKDANAVIDSSFLHNKESSGKHTVTGTLTTEFAKCEVKKPLKCAVKEPIQFKALFEGVEELGPGENTHGVEFKGDPEPNSPIMSIILTNKGEEKCPLAGKTAAIDGTAIATGTPNPEAFHSGATWKFEPGNEMQTLTVAGVKAELTATLTPRMAVGEYPIPFTTVT
jgi:hypothetical protein